jgi:hypothetical protein
MLGTENILGTENQQQAVVKKASDALRLMYTK